MTKDYEVDRIEEEIRHEMQSPYTRAEFIDREITVYGRDLGLAGGNADAAERAGIVWRQEPKPEPELEHPPVDPLSERITALEHRLSEACDRCSSRIQSVEQNLTRRIVVIEKCIRCAESDLERRENLHAQAIGELSARINRELGEDDPNDECDTVAERLDDLETRIQALDRRVGDEIYRQRTIPDGLIKRILALEAASNVNVLQRVARVESEWQTEGQKLAADRRQLRAFVADTIGRTDAATAELRSRVDKLLREQVDVMWKLLYGLPVESEDEQPGGLAKVVRRLDADVAILRDIVCPPQGAPGLNERVEALEADFLQGTTCHTATAVAQSPTITAVRAGELVQKLRRTDALFDINGNRVWGERAVDEVQDLLQSVACPSTPPQHASANQADPNWNIDNELWSAVVGWLANRMDRAAVAHAMADVPSNESKTVEWPDPTPEMLESPVFEAIWGVIRTWDVAVPGAYTGYTAATGNHVRAILDGIDSVGGVGGSLARRLRQKSTHVRQTREALRAACAELGADSEWSDETSLADVVSKVLMPAVRDRLWWPGRRR